jgi:hypothetical protein
MGLVPAAGFEELKKLKPAVPAPSVAVPRTALPLLELRNDTEPVGAVLALPLTVAVRSYALPLGLAAMVVNDGQRPVTVSDAALEVLPEYAVTPLGVPTKTAL